MDDITRVMILGGSGAGKTYLAHMISDVSGLRCHHMDRLSWQPGFVHRPTHEMDAITRDLHAQDHWIIEGGHYETCHERARRAQLLVWVDPAMTVQLVRVMWRAVRHHGKVRPGMGQGCVERLGPRTWEALCYARSSRAFHRDRARQIIGNAPASLAVRHLRTTGQTRRFLTSCRPLGDRPGFVLDPS